MKTHLRVLAIVISILILGCGTVSAHTSANSQSVVINLDQVPRMVSTQAETVGELLQEIDETMDADYLLEEDIKEDDPITNMMNINLISVTEKITSITSVEPFETITKESTELELGEKKVVQEGVDGQYATIHKEVFHGGKFQSKDLVEKKTIVEKQDKIIEVGVPHNNIDGYEYERAINAKVTAYTPFDPGCTGITATGTVAKKGSIAVDPSVIPLGSKIYVPGYGVGIAEDTGGAIKGNRLDVCYESRDTALQWGVKNLTVYILSE